MIFSRQVNQFIKLVEIGSYVKAADEISVTPSALSHGIRELELRLGKKLLTSNRNKISLTNDGCFFYNEIVPIYNHAQKVMRKIMNKNHDVIIKTDGFSYPGMMGIIECLLTNFEENISIIKGNSTQLLESIDNGECDIVIKTQLNKRIETHPENFHLSLSPENFGIVVKEDIFSQYASIKDLLEKQCLLQCSTALTHPIYKILQQKMEEHNIQSVFIGLPEIENVHHAIINGLGANLISEKMMNDETLKDQGLHFIKKPFPFDTYLYRSIHFKRERFSDLINIATCIQGK